MTVRWEYVASGLGHLKIFNVPMREIPEAMEVVNGIFSNIRKDNHEFSFLFNAYVEEDYGRIIKEYYKDSIYSIHADSGGLQVVTRGHKLDDALKQQVYKTQAKYSDIAMSFDEIPLIVSAETSNVNDLDVRTFDTANLEMYARKSGVNIKNQIELFLDEKTTAKPMIILQGNCFETFMQWFDYVLAEIPPSYHKHIAGISVADTAHGLGFMEDIERAVLVGQLAGDFTNYFHLLGIGSIKRLLPYITFCHNGYFKDIHISYDSTTHTSGVSLGKFVLNTKNDSLGRHYSDKYVKVYEELCKMTNFQDVCNVTEFHKIVNANSTYFHDKTTKIVDKEKLIQYYQVRLNFFRLSVESFKNNVDLLLPSKKKIISIADRFDISKEINTLFTVKSLEDFEYWKKYNSSTTRSKKVKKEISNLEGFFD